MKRFMKRLFRKIALQHTIPQYLIFDGLGFIWASYFVWQHQLILALVVLIVSWLLASFVVRKKNEEAYAKTPFGRLMLSHLAPWSLAFHIPGYIVLIYSFWVHSGFYILLAISLILLGHLRNKTKRTH
ncbi:hypothetical protein IH979_02815 [Patescibacteria group bacterium]|nr:hypothetical protein [Patescibacteria group bacterium]